MVAYKGVIADDTKTDRKLLRVILEAEAVEVCGKRCVEQWPNKNVNS